MTTCKENVSDLDKDFFLFTETCQMKLALLCSPYSTFNLTTSLTCHTTCHNTSLHRHVRQPLQDKVTSRVDQPIKQKFIS